jgi:DNA polymerase-3 subunit delta'
MVEVGNMEFEKVIGQSRVKKNLVSSIVNQRLAHAYLFTGPQGVGKDALALAMAMGLNCENHLIGGCQTCLTCIRVMRNEDAGFHFIQPVPSRPKSMKEEKYNEILRERSILRLQNPYKPVNYSPELNTLPAIGIDQIRWIKHESRLMLSGSRMRIFMISQAEKMTVPAANSLLKLLEEPPGDTMFLLTTSVPEQLLSTILSRCQRIRLDMISENDIEEALIGRWQVPSERAGFIAGMSGGSLQRALELSEGDFEWRRDLAMQLLEGMVEDDPLTQIEGFETLQKNLDKHEIREVLQVLLMLLRDVHRLHNGLTESLLTADRGNPLHDFNLRHPDFDPDRAAQSVLRAIDFSQKNVYLPLILFSLDQHKTNS